MYKWHYMSFTLTQYNFYNDCIIMLLWLQIMQFNNRRLFAIVNKVDKPPRKYIINEEKKRNRLEEYVKGSVLLNNLLNSCIHLLILYLT